MNANKDFVRCLRVRPSPIITEKKKNHSWTIVRWEKSIALKIFNDSEETRKQLTGKKQQFN